MERNSNIGSEYKIRNLLPEMSEAGRRSQACMDAVFLRFLEEDFLFCTVYKIVSNLR